MKSIRVLGSFMTTNFKNLPETSSNAELPSANWGQGRRLEFIDFRLRWDKTFNRSDLTSHFSISVPQASMDIARYTQLAAQNLEYDRSLRTYRATAQYAPAVGNTEPQRYLNELLASEQGLLSKQESYIGWRPPFAAVPVPTRLVEGSTLSILLDAIREQTCVRIRYQSDSAPDPVERVISPHAFGFDGFRWHVRAYCFLRDGYRDFVLGRILEIVTSPELGIPIEQDCKWFNLVTVSIGPRPSLSPGNRRAVELDYSMVDGQATLHLREALLYYALKALGLGPFSSSSSIGEQLVLLNERELAEAIAGAFSSTARHPGKS
jgi:hypothetical protein